ncbi:type IV pilus assembly protein PilM [Candidatus Woesebacteria bacterium]|nr:type IV pilus assembly protein PilM [Candidatus Woesebacteria bacterium]
MNAYFGLDIGSSSIKVTKSSLLGSKAFSVEANGLAMNPAGSTDFSNPVVTAKLGPAIKQLLSETKIKEKRVVVAIAESRVYSRILTMPQMSEAELSSAIKWEAEQFVPIPVAEVELDFSILEQQVAGASDKKMLVYLVAAPKNYLQAMVNFLTGIGLEPIAVESEMVAVSRALTFGNPASTSMILHMGAMSSVLAIVDGTSLSFAYVTESGGVSLTRALAQSLSLPLPQAEEYKRTYGLDPAQMEGKVKTGLQIILDGIVNEMRKAMEYHLSSRKTRVTRIVLSGGGAYLPEFSVYLSEIFGGIEVVVGDPYAVAKASRGVVIPRERSAYSVAVGLSQRVF